MRAEHGRTIDWACRRKAAFLTRAEAQAAVRRLRAAGIANARHLRSYLCPFAGAEGCHPGRHWHYGHPLTIAGMQRVADAIRDLPPRRVPA